MANLDVIVKELQQQRDRLDAAIEALTSLSGNTLKASHTGHIMSAAARRRIAAAQRARWAKQKSQMVVPIKAGKRHISAAGLARIRVAARARWAKVKAGKKWFPLSYWLSLFTSVSDLSRSGTVNGDKGAG
jgi:hypothetical protein